MAKAGDIAPHLQRAARATLAPLGCTQVGRSRTWIADQGFWTIIIEFQPSSFAALPNSIQKDIPIHLNVGANWLWYPKAFPSFDYSHRVLSTSYGLDEPSMIETANHFAVRAAEQVAVLRRTFPSISDIARRLIPDERAARWGIYHAAIANGLAGNTFLAQQYFDQLQETPAAHEWEHALLLRSRALAAQLFSPADFRTAVTAIVMESRTLQNLPTRPTDLELA
ncbi:hypothetical protein VPG91_22350 [Nitrospirillum amazonense]|uniref:hypothetical protein n=1 Tax=Nitrospirillum amazonense TaxID=28077 RepID=UPI002DD44F09|nr:hypothetical protein [Nitrospirillum amazonense]MEC4593759.1 hypothetical protein [Nitrospirillum amazonense]